jgi:ribonuclease P protein component
MIPQTRVLQAQAYQAKAPMVLKKRGDFLAMKSGKRFRGPLFLLSTRDNGLDVARIGYTITKKQGNAVQRNRMRRRLKALVQQEAAQFAASRDYVITADASLLNAPHETLRAELTKRVSDAVRKTAPQFNRT